MLVFTDTVFNQRTGRHELHLVNQQYDLLYVICWSEQQRDYVEHPGMFPGGVTPEEMQGFIEVARSQLPLADGEKQKTGA